MSVLSRLKHIAYQPIRPFATTQPISYELKDSVAASIMGWKPLSSIMYVIPSWRKHFTNIRVNERLIELPFIFRHLDPSKNPKVLDIGCCESTVSMSLASLGCKVTGIDIRDYPLTHHNFTFVKEDISHTTLKPGSFDYVVCLSTIEHIGLETVYGSSPTVTDDVSTLTSIHTLLKKGGTLLLTTPIANKYHVTEFQRLYSLPKIKSLLKGFEITFLETYVPNAQRSEWSKGTTQRLPAPPNFGVVTLAAKKRT